MSEAHDSILANAFKPLELVRKTHSKFFEMWEEVDFKRHEFITEPGKIDRYFYVVISGVQCIYLIAPNGDKQVIGFSFDGSFSGVYDSFAYEKPSHYFLEALTPSKLLRINKSQYDSLFEIYPEFEHWGRVVHLQLLIGRVNREVELITKTSKERFEAFLSRCPKELEQIPQKYLAWYLNMSPETFSRMRASKS
ncbi:MAG: Crp/Fnr family transcriptional regulator [Crocinitomicaceae bacterium]|nr:Crp/Fnr family transcriptional regulator [Crocinitomicaceae bacterium]